MKDLIVYKKFTLHEAQQMPQGWGEVAWYRYPKTRKRALKENPPSSNFLITCLIQGVYAKDRSFIDKAAEIVKTSMKESDILKCTGSALYAIGYKEEGVAKLREAVKQDPCVGNIVALTDELENPEEYDEKAKLCRQVLKENPNDIDALRGLIFVLVTQNKLDESKEYLKHALHLAPKNAGIIESYAELLFRTGDFKSAIDQYKRAQRLSFKYTDARIWQQIAYCYHNLGKSNEAQKAALKVLKTAKRDGFNLNSPEIKGFLIKLGKDSDFFVSKKSLSQKLSDLIKGNSRLLL